MSTFRGGGYNGTHSMSNYDYTNKSMTSVDINDSLFLIQEEGDNVVKPSP